MRMRPRTFIATVALAAVLTAAGCATLQGVFGTSLVVSGETINSTGELFVSTAKGLTPPCNAKQLPADFCASFKAFEQKFKRAWPQATGLWYTARDVRDTKLQAPAADAVKALRNELDTFVAGSATGGK